MPEIELGASISESKQKCPPQKPVTSGLEVTPFKTYTGTKLNQTGWTGDP